MLLTGGASATAAHLVTSKHIKDGTIAVRDLSLPARRALTGPIGPIGPPGSNGPAGATGQTGPSGPAGVPGASGPQGLPGSAGLNGRDGRDGAAGPSGTNGAAGASAYEVAVNAGYIGSRDEWIASLRGPQGPTGAQGPKGDTGAVGPQGLAGSPPKPVRRSESRSVAPGGYVIFDVSCLPGEWLIGGGGGIYAEYGHLGINAPISETAWRISAKNTNTTSSVSVDGYVLCISGG